MIATTALVVTVSIAVLSIFFILVGLPGSYTTVSESCSLGNPCVQMQQSGTSFIRVPAAIIPLLATVLVTIGLVMKSRVLSWSAILVLLVFSFLTAFSVGMIFLPLVIVLVCLMAAIRSNGRSPTAESGSRPLSDN